MSRYKQYVTGGKNYLNLNSFVHKVRFEFETNNIGFIYLMIYCMSKILIDFFNQINIYKYYYVIIFIFLLFLGTSRIVRVKNLMSSSLFFIIMNVFTFYDK